MMIEYQRESVCVSEASVAAFSQSYQETDVIVPDSKPDVASILQVDATAAVISKICRENRVDIEAAVRINILYVGDDGTVKSINASQHVLHQMEANGVAESMSAELECDVENVEFEIVNSRKLSVRSLIGFDARVSMPLEIDVITGGGDESVETLSRCIRPYSAAGRVDSDITVREKLEVPAGKPGIGTVLKTDTAVKLSDLKLASGKIILKGSMAVTTLYIGDMEENVVQFMEHEVSFTEILEVSGAEENMTADIVLGVKDCVIDIVEDSDGDARIMLADAKISISGRVSRQVELNIIEDLYSTSRSISAVKNTALVDKIVADKRTAVTLSEAAALPPDMPGIQQVYNVIAKPYLSGAKTEHGFITVEGVIDVYILYLSTDESRPICTYKHEQPFSHRIEAENVAEDMFCDARVGIDSTSFNINLEREIQLRLITSVQAKVIATEKMEYVADVTENADEPAAADSGACIRIYFVQQGERLWDIAKRYRTTISSLLAVNELTSEAEVRAGGKLLIP